jgi:hypothetical protein
MLFTHDFGDTGTIPVIYDRSRSTNHSQYSCLIQPHDPTIAKPLIYEAVGRSIYMENNTEVQTAAILRGGEVTYYDAVGEVRATGNRSDFARQWELWKHESCPKAGFCKPSSATGWWPRVVADAAAVEAAVLLRPREVAAVAVDEAHRRTTNQRIGLTGTDDCESRFWDSLVLSVGAA